MNQSPERKLAAIMFTDIAGYTALSGKDENKALELLDTQRQLLTPIIEEFNGTLHKEIGDGLLFTFPTVTEAVKCGIKIQEQTKAKDDLNLRIGIHEGEITLKDGDALGDDVNVASRIEAFSPSGGIAISGKVQQNISSLPEFETSYIGIPELKGVSQKIEVYCITSHGLPKTEEIAKPVIIENKSNFNIFALSGGILTAIGIAFWIAVGVFDVSFGGKVEVPSVGVLMMENLGNKEDDFWARGITGDLIIKIASSGNIIVPSMKDVATVNMKNTNEEIAKRLNVKYILTSEIYKKDNDFQLRSQLINVKTGISEYANKWTETNERAANIVNSLAEQLLQVISPNSRLSKNDQMINSKSYQYYLKAKKYGGINEFYRDINNDNLELARNLLEKSVLLDSTNIDAQIQWARSFYYNSDFENSSIILKKALEICKDTKQEKMLGRVYRNLANVEYFSWGSGKGYIKDMPSLNYLKKAAKIAKDNNDIQGYRLAMGNIMNSFYRERHSKTSLDSIHYYADQMFEYAKETNSNEIEAMAYIKLGRNYVHGDGNINYLKATEYYNKAYDISKNLGYDYQIGALTGLEGIANFNLEYYKGIDYLNKLEKLEIITDSKRGLAINFGRKAMYYSSIGDFNEADKSLEKMSKYNQELTSSNNFQALYYSEKARLYLYTLQYEKALDIFKKKLDLNAQSDWLIYFEYKGLGIGYYFANNNKMAKIYFEKAIEFMQLSNMVSDDIDLVIYHYLNEVRLGNLSTSDTLTNPLSSKKHKGTIDDFVKAIKNMDRVEVSLQILDADLYRLYYNIFLIYDLTGNIANGKEFLGLSHKEIMLISSKLNSTDRKRFFSEHKWVSQIVEKWEKVK